MKKKEIKKAIKRTGFQKIRIMDATEFPIEYMPNDPIAQAVLENQKITPENIREIGKSVISIKIYGVKPSVSN